MGIIRLNKHFGRPRHRRIWDKSLNLKDILFYAGITILGIVLLLVVIGIPYMIGKASVNCAAPIESQSNETAQVESAISLTKSSAQSPSKQANATIDTKPKVNKSTQTKTPKPKTVQYDETTNYLRTDPRVATKYTNIELDLLSFNHSLRGTNWGTINRINLSLGNKQSQIIIPYNLKIKIYTIGESASDWWDDEINLRKHLNIIPPNSVKSLDLKVHISFSDVNKNKKIMFYLFDEVGKQMAKYSEEIKITNSTK